MNVVYMLNILKIKVENIILILFYAQLENETFYLILLTKTFLKNFQTTVKIFESFIQNFIIFIIALNSEKQFLCVGTSLLPMEYMTCDLPFCVCAPHCCLWNI